MNFTELLNKHLSRRNVNYYDAHGDIEAILREIPVGTLLDLLGHEWSNGWIGQSWGQSFVRAVGISDTPVGDSIHVLVVKP